jgi:hypothetical protein
LTQNIEKRLREIEDRKIEILMEISSVKDITERMSELNYEYIHLGGEYYKLKLEMIRARQKT